MTRVLSVFVFPPPDRTVVGTDAGGELHESAELPLHLPSAGRQAESIRRAEWAAEVPDCSGTCCVSKAAWVWALAFPLWFLALIKPQFGCVCADDFLFGSFSDFWYWMRWISWTVKLRTSSTPSLSGRTCPSPDCLSSVRLSLLQTYVY